MVFLVLVFVVSDFALRIFPDSSNTKQVSNEFDVVSAVVLNKPEKSTLDKHIFGEIFEQKKAPEQVKKVAKKEYKLTLLAVYSAPKKFVYVKDNKSNTKPKKLALGDEINGYKLANIKKNTAIFKNSNKTLELKVFKGK